MRKLKEAPDLKGNNISQPEADINDLSAKLAQLLTGKADKKAIEQVHKELAHIFELLKKTTAHVKVIEDRIQNTDDNKLTKQDLEHDLLALKAEIEVLQNKENQINKISGMIDSLASKKDLIDLIKDIEIAKMDLITLQKFIKQLRDSIAELRERQPIVSYSGGGGSGDMKKSVYDSNNDGVIAIAQLDTDVAKKSEREAASGYAGLDASSKVIKDPANATATPTASKIPIADGSGKLDGWISASSTTVSGLTEAAIASEVTTGTDTARDITPDALAGSDYGKRIMIITLADPATAVTIGDGKAIIPIPAELNGWNLVAAHASLTGAVSTSGTPTYQIRNVTQAADMLTTRITVDVNEKDSYTAATAPVIDTANDDVATGNLIAIDKDVAGTGEKGDTIILSFQLP